jgi:hypothetical protein
MSLLVGNIHISSSSICLATKIFSFGNGILTFMNFSEPMAILVLSIGKSTYGYISVVKLPGSSKFIDEAATFVFHSHLLIFSETIGVILWH